MGNRLSKIVTRTGDDGSTGLADGSRVPKDTLRVEAIGSVDELNCTIGVLVSGGLPDADAAPCLTEIQHDLFDLGGELAVPGAHVIDDQRLAWLEQQVEYFNAGLPPLKEFVLPGGGTAAAACHVARAVCRRAERRCWTLARAEKMDSASMRYLNRLSDLLFVMARVFARKQTGIEQLWQRERLRPDQDHDTGPGDPTA